MKLMIIIFGLFLCIASDQAHADWVSKRAALTCDPSQNIALIRLDFVENADDPVLVKGPLFTGELQDKYAYLATYKKPIFSECIFSDGRKLAVTDSTGQASAYGMGGADPHAFFTFTINDRPVYYKTMWYAGRGRGVVIKSAIILDGDALLSCEGPESYKEGPISAFKLSKDDCVDESNRLVDSLRGDELVAFNRDIAIREYKPKSVDPNVCQFFSEEKNFESQMSDVYDKRFQPLASEALSEDVYFGRIAYARLDINNDGHDEAVYKVYGHAGYFDGNYFLFFDQPEEEESFTGCVYMGVCPTNIVNNKRQNVDYIIENISLIWPSANIISARSLDDKSGKEYQSRYTHIYPIYDREKTYLYFSPVNRDLQPRAIVAQLTAANELKEICTYKE